ncbi:MAG: hypothetical protein U0235_24075 [Polyangiaceae bacterium]
MSKAQTTKWQLRLAVDEDQTADELAAKHGVSKNDVIRRGLRLLAMVEKLAEDGQILLVQRRGRKERAVEVWLV